MDPATLADVLRFGAARRRGGGRHPGASPGRSGPGHRYGALLQQAQRHLEAAGQLADQHGLGWLRLRVSILRALVADAQGDSRLALGSLAAALAEAEPENVIRPFLDEGERMTVLLTDLSPAAGVSPTFLATLLAAFPSDAPRPHRTGSSSR